MILPLDISGDNEAHHFAEPIYGLASKNLGNDDWSSVFMSEAQSELSFAKSMITSMSVSAKITSSKGAVSHSSKYKICTDCYKAVGHLYVLFLSFINSAKEP